MNIVNLGYRSTNYYALPVNGGKLLVDCGWYGLMGQFLAEFKRKGVDPSEVKYILATHFHMDHAGLVNEFKKRGARLILMENQMSAVVPGEPDTPAKAPLLIATSQVGNILLGFSESREFLSSLGIAGEIVPTPGHSDDSVTLILDDGIAFTGDLAPETAMPEDRLAAAKASWDTIHRHGVRQVFPAHGGIYSLEVR